MGIDPNNPFASQYASLYGPASAPAAAPAPAAPKMADFQGTTDSMGDLYSRYQLQDPGAVKSPWLDQELQQQTMMQNDALNQNAQQTASGTADAQASLARKGGLSTGSAERLADSGQNQSQLTNQNIYNQGQQNRLGMQINDMQQERGYQTGLQQFNLQNTLQGLSDRNNFNLGKYTQDITKYGADKTADATEAAGGSSVICTACHDVGIISDDTYEKAQKFKNKVSKETYFAYLRWAAPVAFKIREVPELGYLFRPLVRYWAGDRDLLACAQFKFFKQFNKLFMKKELIHAVR